VEAIDKGGNFIGWMNVDGKNVSVELVEGGYASAFIMQDRSLYGRQLQSAEDNAKRRKDRMWANYVEKAPEDEAEEQTKKDENEERKISFQKVVVTEV